MAKDAIYYAKYSGEKESHGKYGKRRLFYKKYNTINNATLMYRSYKPDTIPNISYDAADDAYNLFNSMSYYSKTIKGITTYQKRQPSFYITTKVNTKVLFKNQYYKY